MATFRLVSSQDAEALKQLNDLFSGDGCNTTEAIRNTILHNPQEIVCVAEDSGHLAGFCCGQLLLSFCYRVPYGEITELFVLEGYRRRGVGQGMMLWMEAAFRKRGVNDFQLLPAKRMKERSSFTAASGMGRPRR